MVMPLLGDKLAILLADHARQLRAYWPTIPNAAQQACTGDTNFRYILTQPY